MAVVGRPESSGRSMCSSLEVWKTRDSPPKGMEGQPRDKRLGMDRRLEGAQRGNSASCLMQVLGAPQPVEFCGTTLV